jgi:nucleoside-diphosphate-sugar epimerase
MPNVLVTHADEPLGRRILKRLFHDPRVERLLAAGDGPAPRSFDRFLAASPPRMHYARLDLAKHRPVSDLFHSASLREAGIDSVVYVPRHGAGAGEGAPIVSGLHVRTAEARLVLQHCLEVLSIRSLVVVGSAFVYKLHPGNANRLTERSELDLDPEAPAEFRAWIDSDMLFHAEVGNDRLRVVLLRVPTVVASGGAVYLNPALEGTPRPHLRPMGFDPLCALISDKDVAKGVQAAVHGDARGVFNLAGEETLPLSILARWTGRPSVPCPGLLLPGPHLRYGFSLDTSRAEREFGFAPGYHIGLAKGGDGRPRLETSPA